MTRRTVTMTIEYDERVSHPELREFIKSELGCAGGCRRPDDPLFTSIKVTNLKLRTENER